MWTPPMYAIFDSISCCAFIFCICYCRDIFIYLKGLILTENMLIPSLTSLVELSLRLRWKLLIRPSVMETTSVTKLR